MGKSPSHSSSVGRIRNLTTGYISTQFYVVYDCKFQTVMGGYGSNDSIATHIWESMVTDIIIEQAQDEQEPIPPLHNDWLTPDKLDTRLHDNINSEVMRRMQKYKGKDNDTTLGSSGPLHIIHDTQSTAQEDIIQLEENIEDESIQ